MIYRGPGFLAVVWFGSSPTPSPVSKFLSLSHLPVCRQSSFLTGEESWRGWARSQIIILPGESLALYKPSVLSAFKESAAVNVHRYSKLHIFNVEPLWSSVIAQTIYCIVGTMPNTVFHSANGSAIMQWKKKNYFQIFQLRKYSVSLQWIYSICLLLI
jgi:hypothetical protein